MHITDMLVRRLVRPRLKRGDRVFSHTPPGRDTCCAMLMVLSLVLCTSATAKNGFDLSTAIVPAAQIHHGGPPRDGIPALDAPRFIAASEATFLTADQRVLGFKLNGDARAYPINIMNWHEIVNDRFGEQAVAITYCPLCGTGMAFAADVAGQTRQFGVSGLLYQSDVLLYDKESESLWSQLKMQAISGPLRNTRLKLLPMQHTSWQAWQKMHPHTKVLSPDTGFARDYTRDPYAGYAATPALYFNVNHRAPALYHAKEQVLGVVLDGAARAYPFSEISQTPGGRITERWQGQEVNIVWDDDARAARLYDSAGALLPATTAFWFAWYTFYPEGSVYRYIARP